MQIIDAMRGSHTASEICLLVTNYIESLQFYAAAEQLPAAIVTLPVRGLRDVEERYSGLRHARPSNLERPRGNADSGIMSEAAAVLYEAMCCLRALDTATGTLALPPATTEAFRHA